MEENLKQDPTYNQSTDDQSVPKIEKTLFQKLMEQGPIFDMVGQAFVMPFPKRKKETKSSSDGNS